MSVINKNMERLFYFLPHSLVLGIYKILKKKKYKSLQEDRKLIVVGNERYSLKGFDDNRCIFVHIPKAGGVSVATSLFGNLGYGHRPIYKYLYIFNKKEFKEYFKFTFVRNPWDRLVSAYFFLKSGGFHGEDKQWFEENIAQYDGFDGFVLNWLNSENIYKGIHFIPQFEFVTINSKIVIDKVYKIEEFEKSVQDISNRLQTQISLSHKNKTSNREKDYKLYYTPETQKIVEKVYKKDIDLFGYQF